MKIVFCVNSFYPHVGGAESVVKTIVDYLASFHEIILFTRRLKHRKHSDFSYKVVEYNPGESVFFDSELKKIKPDAIFIYSDVFDYFRQILEHTYSDYLFIALCGANWIFNNKISANIIYRNKHKITSFICHSKAERDYRFCSNSDFIDKTIIIPNGINLQEFDSNNINKSQLDSDLLSKKIILNVSNFFPGKNQEFLCDIVSQLPDPESFAYIQIANDIDFQIGAELENKWKLYVDRVKKLNGITIKLKKNISREHVVAYFKQSNVFAFTSLKEVAPLVLLECMASELPWVSMNVGNAQDLSGGVCIPVIKNGQFYAFPDTRVRDSFIKNIVNLCNNPKIGELGRNQVEKQYTWDKILPQYENLLNVSS